MWIALALFFAMFMTPPQRVVAVYQFGCITEISQGPDTTVEVPLDEFGKEQREHAYVVHEHVWIAAQGKGGTPADCAYTKIVH